MQKIMFNDQYGLTQSVLDERKTQTRRIIKKSSNCDINYSIDGGISLNGDGCIYPKYELGEVIAISQCYLDINNPQFDKNGWDIPANHNKMFVKAELMPKKIKITGISIERLQEISNEDCLKEGIVKSTYRQADGNMGCYYWYQGVTNKNCPYGQYIEYNSPREAYASLMDEIRGKGTWDSNPYVFVYEFELIK